MCVGVHVCVHVTAAGSSCLRATSSWGANFPEGFHLPVVLASLLRKCSPLPPLHPHLNLLPFPEKASVAPAAEWAQWGGGGGGWEGGGGGGWGGSSRPGSKKE